MAKLNSVLSMMILLGLVLACGEPSKTEEFKSGRLNYVETLKYGPAGVHGQPGWYVTDRNFYVNDKRWSPDGIKVKDIARCEASPNASAEALKCTSFADSKEAVFILRMNNDQPELVTASDALYGSGDNLGTWVGDGHWLLFREYYFNVTTSERKPIKGLPDDPGKYFRGASPDLKTIIYEEYCFTTRFDLPPGKSHDEEIHQQCELSNEHISKRIIAFWLIDTETGSKQILELKKDKYPALDHNEQGWLKSFQEMLKWKKDKNGRDRLAYPSNDGRAATSN